MKNSGTDHPFVEPSPYGDSAVTTRSLSRRPPGDSAVGAPVHRAVTTRSLSRWRTAQSPSKHRYSALIFQEGCSLSGLILQVCDEHRHAASSAPGARGLADGG
jgi:hypothetical protein